MYHIIDDRASGKTGRLMLIAKENNATFICSNPHAMIIKANSYGITGLNFMSYYDFINSKGTNLGSYVIDEILSFVQYMQSMENINGKLIGYTLSQE